MNQSLAIIGRKALGAGLLTIFALILSIPRSEAQGLQPFSARSVSGQITVNDGRGQAPPGPAQRAGTNVNFLRLEPSLVAVSCERIKQSLARQLEGDSAWRGKIFLVLYAAATTNDNVLISSERFNEGWHYRVALPDVISRTRYVTALTQVLLLEMANRNASQQSTEVPLWLTHGLAQQLLSSSELEIILPPPRDQGRVSATFVVDKKQNPLELAHLELSANPPLTFQELSWPQANTPSDPAGPLYARSAQFFVSELLRLKSGPAHMRQMLADLPKFQNWQFAFLQAFKDKFQRPLDVEKWWALDLAFFTGRQLASETWSLDESWQKLDEIVRPEVQLHAGTNDPPQYRRVSLQTIVRDWERGPQGQAVQEKLAQLQMLRLRVAPEAQSVVDGYRLVLERFLEERDKFTLWSPFRKRGSPSHAASQTIAQLDSLDARRAGRF